MTPQLPTRRYTAAGGVVVDPRGERVLVLVRPQRLGPDGRPEVRLPKGHIEPGESPPKAALREVEEEAGLTGLEVLTDLGQQTVEFDWRGYHFVRTEFYFLLRATATSEAGQPEGQFEPQWLTWESALARLTFEPEREWVRRAWVKWQEAPDSGH